MVAPCRASGWVMVVAGLLALGAVPGWATSPSAASKSSDAAAAPKGPRPVSLADTSGGGTASNAGN